MMRSLLTGAGRSSRARWRTLVPVVLALLALASGTVPARADDGAPQEYLLRVAPAQLARILATYELTLDQTRQLGTDLFVVIDSTGRAVDDLEALVTANEIGVVQTFERNERLALPEARVSAALNQSTAAILETLKQKTLVPFAGLQVWSRFANQPAMTITRVDETHALSRRGAGIVAVIDTGIDPTHPIFAGALVEGYDFTRDTAGTPSELLDLQQSTAAILEQSTAAILEQSTAAILEGRASQALLNQSTAAILEQSTAAILEADKQAIPAAFGHGTMVAGLIRRVAPGARIMPLKAFRADGSSSIYDIIDAVYYAVDHGARVINMSFSVATEFKELKRALDYAEARGVICVASAGNDGLETDVFPAANSHALGVGSTTDADARSSFSNFGDKVFEVAAPGEAIITTFPKGAYAAVWGTSFSTAVVTGGAALLVSPATVTGTPAAVAEADRVTEALRDAIDLAGDGLGKGRVDFLRASLLADFLAANPGADPEAIDDLDGVPIDRELEFGLSPLVDDRSRDDDGDGRTNVQELLVDGTHPRGFAKSFLAEGATGLALSFDTRVAIANPGTAIAHVQMRFQRDDGQTIRKVVLVGPRTRRTVDVRRDYPELAEAEFSTAIESDEDVVVDRAMTWGHGYGSTAERAMTATAATTWYLAEGATHSGLDLFYLVQNPGTRATTVGVTYLRPAPAPPIEVTYQVPAASRFTIWVNQEAVRMGRPELGAADVSAIVTSLDGAPIYVERALYKSGAAGTFSAGHEGAGITSPQLEWFLAEGSTGPYFDTFVLIANPGTVEAIADVTFLMPDGTTIVTEKRIPPASRYNVWIDFEGATDAERAILSNTAVSTTVRVRNGVPVVVERALWWPGSPATWHEAHASAASDRTSTRWLLAEGESGGVNATETYVLVANTSPHDGQVRVTLLFEDGTTAVGTYGIGRNSRLNVNPQVDAAFSSLTPGRRYAVLVESSGPTPVELVVERAMYNDAGAEHWAAGSNALATPLSRTPQ